MAKKIVGTIAVELFARVGGGHGEELSLGLAKMPLSISPTNTRKVEADLTEVFEFAKATLEAVYGDDDEDSKPVPNVATALPQMPTLADLASPGAAARKRVAAAMREKRVEETRDIADVEPSEISDRMRKGFVTEDSFEDERP